MKSSSQLFPVRLSSAESYGDLLVDVYLLKPNSASDSSVELAMTRIGHRQAAERRSQSLPLILFHGCYQNRQLWLDNIDSLSSSSAGMLAEQGYDVWLLEARGHGLSIINEGYESNSLVEYARYDLPAANSFVAEITGTSPAWLAYGEGFGALLLSLASGSLDRRHLAGLLGAGAPFPTGSIRRLPLAQHVAGMIRYGDTSNPLIGPELEPRLLRNLMWREQGVFAYRGKSMGFKLWEVLPQMSVPVALIVGVEGLMNVESGLQTCVEKNGLQVVGSNLLEEDLAPENIAATLMDQQRLANFWKPALEWINHLDNQHDLLPTGTSAPAY